MNVKIVVTGLLALSCVLNTGCGGGSTSNSGSNSSISQTQATDFVSTVAGSASAALGTAAAAQGVQSRALQGLSARIMKGTLAHNPNVKQQKMQVQCNSQGTSCTFSDNFNISDSCQTGGTMSVAGDMNGNGTPNSAYLSLQVMVTPHDWTCDGPTINGDPYVQINGTYTYPADSATMTMSGAFTAGAQTCQLNITVNANSNGSGDISGTACGDSINGTF